MARPQPPDVRLDALDRLLDAGLADEIADEELWGRRASRARFLIPALGAAWLILQAFAVGVAAQVGPPSGPRDADLWMLVLAGLPAGCYAGAGAIVAWRNRDVVGWAWAAPAFIPWLVFSGGALIVVAKCLD